MRRNADQESTGVQEQVWKPATASFHRPLELIPGTRLLNFNLDRMDSDIIFLVLCNPNDGIETCSEMRRATLAARVILPEMADGHSHRCPGLFPQPPQECEVPGGDMRLVFVEPVE